MEMNLSKTLSYSCITYVNPTTDMEVYDKQTGPYGFITSTNSFRVNALSEKTGIQETLDFAIIKSDDYTLVLKNKTYNNNEVYYKIVNTCSTSIGDSVTVDLSNINFRAVEYVSVTPGIVEVDNHGVAAIVGAGTTFIIAKDNKGNKVAMKFEVESNVVKHAAEIDNSINNIYKKYGMPDLEQDQGNGSTIIVYKHPAFEKTAYGLQIHYNNENRNVTRVLVRYLSEKDYLKDVEYMSSIYHYVEFGNYYYCDTDDFITSTFHIFPFEKDGYYISYGSTYQIFTYKHY